MDEEASEVPRRTRLLLAFGLACLPCTAAFLVALGGVGGSAIVAALGWPLIAAVCVLAAAGLAVVLLARRRRRCDPA